MREIKFRAWDKTNKTMWEDPPSLDDYGSINDVIESLVKFKDDRNDCGPFLLMQFTGLKDKNGKEIYIGDIIRLNNISYDPGNDLYYEGIVLIEATDDLGYKITPISPPLDEHHDSTSMWHFAEGDTTKVIGNIYENPDLLEDK